MQNILFFIIGIMITAWTGYSAPMDAKNDIGRDFAYAKSLQNVFAHVSEKALPAVVIIKTAKRIKQYYYLQPRFSDPYAAFAYRFFHNPQIIERETDPVPSGQASGFFISKDGYILTNAHVVRNQSSFRICLKNGDEYDAKIVGIDNDTDLAVLKINTDHDMPYLKFADPDSVKVGHYAIAVGAPYGLGHTITTGVVSYMGRTAGMNPYENYIQTDAAINPGNSGGPLLNLDEEVIGVNDFILSPPGSRGNIGLGFAISGKLAKYIAFQLMKNGKADKPWVGIAMRPLDLNLKVQNNLSHGVMVTALYANGPADSAKIQLGDLILRIDETNINLPEDLRQAIMSYSPNDKVVFVIKRNGKKMNVDVTIGTRPSDEKCNNFDFWRK